MKSKMCNRLQLLDLITALLRFLPNQTQWFIISYNRQENIGSNICYWWFTFGKPSDVGVAVQFMFSQRQTVRCLMFCSTLTTWAQIIRVVFQYNVRSGFCKLIGLLRCYVWRLYERFKNRSSVGSGQFWEVTTAISLCSVHWLR